MTNIFKIWIKKKYSPLINYPKNKNEIKILNFIKILIISINICLNNINLQYTFNIKSKEYIHLLFQLQILFVMEIRMFKEKKELKLKI